MAPTETTMKLTDTKQQLSQVINRVARGETRVVVEKSGLPVAAIIPIGEYRRLKECEVADAVRRAHLHDLFSRFGEAFADVPEDELQRQIEHSLNGGTCRDAGRARGGAADVIRVVVDTNVVAAGLASYPRGATAPARILHAVIDQSFTLSSSEPLVA